MEKDIKYVVVVTRSADTDVSVSAFTDYAKAKAYMHKLWEENLNTELEANESVDMENTYCKDEFAEFTWADGSYIHYNLTYLGSEIDPE